MKTPASEAQPIRKITPQRCDVAFAAFLEHLRPFAVSLIVFPLIVAFFGTHWSWSRMYAPNVARLYPNGFNRDPSTWWSYVDTGFKQDGTAAGQGVLLEADDALVAALPRPVDLDRYALELQADFNDEYVVSVAGEDAVFRHAWTAPKVALGQGLETRVSPVMTASGAVKQIKVEPARGTAPFHVSGIRLARRPTAILPHAWLALALIIAWVALTLFMRWSRSRRWAEFCLWTWAWADGALACVLIYLVLFRFPGPFFFVLFAAILVIALVIGARLAFKRLSWSVLTFNLAFIVLALLLAPVLLRYTAIRRVARDHNLSVDHRMIPDGYEVNADSIRFRGVADDVHSNEFVILFMGDSFTYGLNLTYEQAFPYAVERILNSNRPERRVRAVNMGWISCSPLLAYRLLLDIGPKYKPDLLIYTLDMTDFADDLKYETALVKQQVLSIDSGTAVDVVTSGILSRMMTDETLDAFKAFARPLSRHEAARCEKAQEIKDYFFVTSQPLEQSRAYIKRGVIRNLARIHAFAANQNARMLLVVAPRAYQYSSRESPYNWEAAEYEILGPYVKEPFRYFEELRDELPYPVLNLLPVFETARTFPLYFEDDPHWNEYGAALVAETIAGYLLENELTP